MLSFDCRRIKLTERLTFLICNYTVDLKLSLSAIVYPNAKKRIAKITNHFFHIRSDYPSYKLQNNNPPAPYSDVALSLAHETVSDPPMITELRMMPYAGGNGASDMRTLEVRVYFHYYYYKSFSTFVSLSPI